MPAPRISREEAQRRFDLLAKALRAGHPPPGVSINARRGEKGALTVAIEQSGYRGAADIKWLQAAERILGPFPWADYVAPPRAFETEPIPSPEPDYESLVERMIEDFHRRKQHRDAVRLITIQVRIDGPYGVLVMGDPHLDDPGTDWPMLRADIRTIKRTPGLFCGNVGDLRNNWVGRLARLYSQQSITATQSLILAEGFLNELREKILWIDGGNHDVWSGADDPLVWIARQAGITYQWHGNRLRLLSPNGAHVIINSRHDHPGWSLWNPSHGPLKAAQLDALHDDIYTCGHLHTGAYQLFPHPNINTISHLFRASGYKIFDGYADARGLTARHLPRGVFVIDPEREQRHRITFFADPELAADFLTHLRRRYEGGFHAQGSSGHARRPAGGSDDGRGARRAARRGEGGAAHRGDGGLRDGRQDSRPNDPA